MAKPSFHTHGSSSNGGARLNLPRTSVKTEGFTILYSGEEDIVAEFGVIFVHGLQGHPRNTWTKELSQPDRDLVRRFFKFGFSRKRKAAEQDTEDDVRNVFWPQDLLPQEIKNIRILSYGYDSKVTKFVRSVNRNGIYQYAENLLSALDRVRSESNKDVKIIFVAHSLGGIIVKEVLRQSSNHTHQPHLLSIFNATYGIVFFGCPHQGSSAVGWGLVAANLARLAGMSPNADLLRSLGMDSPTLRIISSDFSVFMKDNTFKVHSFREEKGMTGIAGISGKVVEDVSSIIGDAAEGKEGISANHRDMCRFGSLEDDGFLKAAGVISRYVRDIAELKNSQKAATRKTQRNDLRPAVTRSSGARKDTAQETKESYNQRDFVFSQEEKGCLQNLAFADYPTYRYRIQKRHPGTLEWVQNHKVYQKWVSKGSMPALLWLSGNPGCGKTVISAFLLDYLEERAKTTNAKVAYFFCDDKQEKQKSAQSLLRGLIHQLVVTTPSLIKHAMVHYINQGAIMVESLDTLWRIFLSIIIDPLSNGTYIILDALDECEKTSRDDLLRRLSEYFRSSSETTDTYLKVLITSRPYPEIQILLQEQPTTTRLKVEDEERNINADISSFVSHKVDELAKERGYDLRLKEEVQKALQAGADGMFLWVSLIVEELLDTPISLVSETLASIPNSLNGLYTHLLRRLDGRKAKVARHILTWVVTAPRPMRVVELAIACSIKSSHRSASSIENVLITGFKQDIALCGPILKIQGGIVYLVHQSAKEFLLDPVLHSSLPDFSISPKQANHELAITCLTYLSFDEFSPGLTDVNISHYSRYKFLSFAAICWPQFVRDADENHPMIWQSFYRLAQSKERLGLASIVFYSAIPWIDYRKPADPLFVSAYHGFRSFVAKILEQGRDANDQGGECSSLYAAASSGHEAVAQLLLEKGADLNASCGYFGKPLHIAAANGHEAVVRLLLEMGADVNAQTRSFFANALQAAAGRGQTAIVRLLVEKGADINRDGDRESALHTAAEYGHEAVVLLLLEKGADPRIPDSHYHNALQSAACGGLESVVHLLLDCGIDVNARGGAYGSALQAAEAKGHLSIVRLLLERGADVNSQDAPHHNAPQVAEFRNHQFVIDLLLGHDTERIEPEGGG